MIFWPARQPPRSGQEASFWSRAATATPSSSPPKARQFFTRFGLAKSRASARNRCKSAIGVDPRQVPDFIALRGDPSDKLPGAAGVGPKRAAQLIRRYHTLEGVLEAGFFRSQADELRLFRSIATMDASAPLPSLVDKTPTWDVAAGLAREWGLNQLADRLTEKAKAF